MKAVYPKRSLPIWTTFIGLALVGYFVYHTIEGERGWLAMKRMEKQVSEAQGTLAQLQAQHKEMEDRVQNMRPEHLDPDLLDEESRKQLDYSKPNDVIVLLPQNKNDGGK